MQIKVFKTKYSRVEHANMKTLSDKYLFSCESQENNIIQILKERFAGYFFDDVEVLNIFLKPNIGYEFYKICLDNDLFFLDINCADLKELISIIEPIKS